MMAVAALLAALLVPPQGTQQQQQPPTEAQLREQIQKSTAEIRRTALENARAQLEAQRAQLEAQRTQIEAGRNAGGAVVAGVPPVPAIPPAPGITITRDGQPVVGGDNGPGDLTTHTGDPGPGQILFRPEIPEGAVILGVAFFLMLAFIAVGLPLARAWARRMDRQSSAPTPFPSDVTDRLERIEHAVESIAIEVERVSEGQRFTTKLLTERGDGAAAAAIPAAARPDEYAGGGR